MSYICCISFKVSPTSYSPRKAFSSDISLLSIFHLSISISPFLFLHFSIFSFSAPHHQLRGCGLVVLILWLMRLGSMAVSMLLCHHIIVKDISSNSREMSPGIWSSIASWFFPSLDRQSGCMPIMSMLAHSALFPVYHPNSDMRDEDSKCSSVTDCTCICEYASMCKIITCSSETTG